MSGRPLRRGQIVGERQHHADRQPGLLQLGPAVPASAATSVALTVTIMAFGTSTPVLVLSVSSTSTTIG
ncbi:hypothetical protein [Mycolicibacterium sp.]|uniref:hypothetical protein n=1 Tax=Mycolicibacterium sp. TaxID=2320850 RepID=UPI0028AAB8F5|nr:hypothetical protein [Mycolicibacterium sp.]